MLLDELAETSAAVAQTSSRLRKIGLMASCLARLRPDEVPVAVAYLSGGLPHGRIGVGWASFRKLPPPKHPPPTLELLDVDAAFRRIGALAGSGSQAKRKRELAELFRQTTEAERTFLLRLLSSEIRQGALEGVMVEAIARAASVAATAVRRALMVAGNLGEVATAALTEGEEGLARFRLRLLTPLQPMLAQTAEDLDDALARISPAGVEWKLDGARIQVHRLGDEVRVFTRNLVDASHRAPEVVQAIAELPVRSIVLDGEAIALRAGGRPHPFQVTMSRFGSRVGVDELSAQTPLSCFFFDCLHLDGTDLLDLPAEERRSAMEERLPQALCVPRVVARSVAEADRFLDEALGRGHEGVMVKALDAPYEAGRRGAGWLKVKRAVTLDLVVLAAEWGHGRREGWLSNLHLGARDPSTGGFVMLGKTFKGMTDEMLRWQTERLLELETHREGITVYVRPELVVEVAFDGLQVSTRYPGGLALRFARVKGYRPDKRADEADTIDTVRALYRVSSGAPPGDR
ncbi:MAG: ATP-dependent DNA ligase [Actinobacteria bacterium]|nr:ATP-dependent DNA ligase [Actinomycetota bacterium]